MPNPITTGTRVKKKRTTNARITTLGHVPDRTMSNLNNPMPIFKTLVHCINAVDMIRDGTGGEKGSTDTRCGV